MFNVEPGAVKRINCHAVFCFQRQTEKGLWQVHKETGLHIDFDRVLRVDDVWVDGLAGDNEIVQQGRLVGPL